MTMPSDAPRSAEPAEEREWRKKPVTIRAMRWTGDNLREVIGFTGRHPSAADWSWEHFEEVVARDGLIIFTLEGKHLANVGDYIIRGVKGEFYPCKPDIFALTYEPADDERRALAARPEEREAATLDAMEAALCSLILPMDDEISTAYNNGVNDMAAALTARIQQRGET